MTLSELADLVCLKVRQSDDAAVTAAKQFLARRAEMMWQNQLWKDALQEVNITLGTDGSSTLTDSVWIPSRGTLLFPPDMDRILAVRSSEREMVAEPMATYFRHDPDTLSLSGTAKEYHLLPPVVWEFATASTLYLTPDSTETGNYRLVTSPDGTRKVVSTGVLTASATIASVLVVWQATKSSNVADVETRGSRNVTVSGAGVAGANGAYTTSDGGTWTNTAGYTIQTIGGTCRIYTPVDDVVIGSEVGLYEITATAFPDGTWTVLDPAYGTAPTVTWTDVAFTMELADNSVPLRQRIRLVELPTGELVLRVLFKLKFPTFENDNDPCPLQAAENALIAFGCADMLQRERQYGKAQALQAEGQALLGQLIENETAQQANRPRLIPGEGYGSEVYASSPLTF